MWQQVKLVLWLTAGVLVASLSLTFAWTNRQPALVRAWGIADHELPVWAVLGVGLLLGLSLAVPILAVLGLRALQRERQLVQTVKLLRTELDALRTQPLPGPASPDAEG